MSRIHVHCPACGRPDDYPVDATEQACPCGRTLRKVRVALPFGWSELGEKLWAESLGERRYALENVPLCARGLNARDEVLAVSPPHQPEEIPQVVEVVERGGRTTFWIRLTSDEAPGAVIDDLAPDDRTWESAGSIHALDVPTAKAPAVRERLEAARDAERLVFEVNDATSPGRFDDPHQDLLGQGYLRLEREGAAPPAHDRTPIDDAGLEERLWARLGWASGAPRPRHLRVRLLDTEAIRERSGGPILLPRTLNPRTLVPKHQGLFAPEVWGHGAGRGPEGLLASYDQRRLPRREARGWYGPPAHVELPWPVRHPWFPDAEHPSLRLDVVPVLPPGERPVIILEGGRMGVGDVNYLYMQLVDLTHRADVTADLLQAAVDGVFDNERLDPPFTLDGGPLSSLPTRFGPDPRKALELLDGLLGAGELEDLRGPLPAPAFRVVRALEACCVAVEAR